jgi:hypothetical protein
MHKNAKESVGNLYHWSWCFEPDGTPVHFRYKISLLKPSVKALLQSTRVSVRTDNRGFLSMQYMIKTEDGQVCFVEFFVSSFYLCTLLFYLNTISCSAVQMKNLMMRKTSLPTQNFMIRHSKMCSLENMLTMKIMFLMAFNSFYIHYKYILQNINRATFL